MGKKRRYIQRATKFGKKAFNFLDKLDGTRDSKLLSSKLDTFISEITLVDRGNRTFSIQVEGMGPGTGGNGLQADKVVYTIDDAAVHANGKLTFAAAAGVAANDRDNYVTNKPAPARAGSGASDVLLAAGNFLIEAIIQNEAGDANVSKPLSKTLILAEASKSLSLVTAAEGAGGDAGKIKIAATGDINLAAADTDGNAGEAAGRLPGEEAFTLGSGVDKNDLDIVVKDSTGAAVACKAVGGEYSVDGTTNTTIVDTDDLQTGIHLRKLGEGDTYIDFPAGPYTVVITPNTVGGDTHTPSAITLSVSIAE